GTAEPRCSITAPQRRQATRNARARARGSTRNRAPQSGQLNLMSFEIGQRVPRGDDSRRIDRDADASEAGLVVAADAALEHLGVARRRHEAPRSIDGVRLVVALAEIGL